uniref:Uncharacterized protein n=1 Tax=Arundo donax TaxID=35708 RepID=A0A0A9H0Q9_ARUDO
MLTAKFTLFQEKSYHRFLILSLPSRERASPQSGLLT